MNRKPSDDANANPAGAPAASAAASSVRIVRCPACGGDSVYGPANRFRPFCSERCKGLDLGAWASEQFRVPAAAPPDDPTQDHPPIQ